MSQPTTSDWVLIAYIFILVPLMLVGFAYARRKMFEPNHKLVMTTITISNWFLIGAVMAVSYLHNVEPEIRKGAVNQTFVIVATLHALFGLTAQSVATYLVIRMWFENYLPEWFKVKNIKRYMRFTLTMWLLTATMGLATWFVFYRSAPTGATDPYATPAATKEATPGKTEEATKSAATPGKTEEATKAPATPGATEDTTKAATPGKTEEATKSAATPGKTEAATKPAATFAPAPTTIAATAAK